MGKFKDCLTNKNDLYMYFEVAKQIEPGKILDVGMFLKRSGLISRHALLREIDREVYMCGIDFMPDCDVGIYDTVYNEIITADEFILKSLPEDEKYDLAYVLKIKEEYDWVWSYVAAHARYAVLDRKSYNSNYVELGKYTGREFKIDDDEYVIVTLN